MAVSAPSKSRYCGLSLAGIVSLLLLCVCCECCVSSGRRLCVGLITRPEESYRVSCVSVAPLAGVVAWEKKYVVTCTTT